MVSAHRKFGFLFAAAGVALSLTALIPTAATAEQMNVSCSPTKMKIAISETGTFTVTSTVFKNIGETTLSFTQGGTKPSCVVVRFSSMTASGGSRVFVRASLDDGHLALPSEVSFSGGDSIPAKAYAFDFVFPSVPPGAHVLRMQFRSTGALGALGRHNTIVQYAP